MWLDPARRMLFGDADTGLRKFCNGRPLSHE